MRGVTAQPRAARVGADISTRTPHAGSDAEIRRIADEQTFQPALPMRGVTSDFDDEIAARKFQPALPMRGVTIWRSITLLTDSFQPALPMRGVTIARSNR